MDTPVQALGTILPEPFLPAGSKGQDLLWGEEPHLWTPALVSHYLERYSQAGDLVLDPFASQPALLQAAATSRRRLVLNHFSPAASLALQVGASPPDRASLDAVFTRMADAPRRGRTLAERLMALYETICPECARTCTASYFIWDRDSGEPVEKAYHCLDCQSAGRVSVDMADIELAASFEIRGAAYWGLLSRLVAPGDPQTAAARALIELYTPRALIAVSELIIAMEQRLDQSEDQQVGRALILHALQRCISLRPVPDDPGQPGTRERPATQPLHPPQQSLEHNVWLAFEEAYHRLRARETRYVPLATGLAALLRPEGEGLAWLSCLLMHDLTQELETGSVDLVLSSPPPFDPGMYALSFLWTGWLFGRERASRLKQMLAVRGASWDWYARVMAVALRGIRPLLRPDGHLVLAFSDRSARRLLALLIAADQAGFRLVAQATQVPLTRTEELAAWRFVFDLEQPVRPKPAETLEDLLQQASRDAANALIEARGEPIPLTLLHSACSARWLEAGLLAPLAEHDHGSRRPVSFLVRQARLALAPDMPPENLRFHPAIVDDDQAQWAPVVLPASPPLADRVERRVAGLLQTGSQSLEEVFNAVYADFPGWETPDRGLVAACIESYGLSDGDVVRLREEDQPERRARDRGEMLLRLHDLGHRLGFQVWVGEIEKTRASGLVPLGRGGPLPSRNWTPAGLVWHEDGHPSHAFALAVEAVLLPWLLPAPDDLGGCPRYVVLPGGRAALLDYKLRRCPAWRGRLAVSGWEFIKFRHLRKLAAQPDLGLAGFRARIALDPVVALPGSQLALFDELPDNVLEDENSL